MYMLIYVCGNIFTYVGKINVLYLNHSYVSRLVDHGNSRWDSWKVFPVCYWTPRLVPSPPANMQGAGRTMVIRSADWTVSWKDVTSFFLIWRQRNPSVTLNFVYSNNNSPNRFSFPVVVVKLTSLCSFSPQQKQKFANFTGVTVTILHLLWSPSNSKYSLRIFRFWIFLHIINFFCEWNQLWYPFYVRFLFNNSWFIPQTSCDVLRKQTCKPKTDGQDPDHFGHVVFVLPAPCMFAWGLGTSLLDTLNYSSLHFYSSWMYLVFVQDLLRSTVCYTSMSYQLAFFTLEG